MPIWGSRESEADRLRREMVDRLVRRGYLHSTQVEQAFRTVERHLFVPEVDLERAYADDVVPTKTQDGVAISSSSQPAMMAIMLEQLGLEPGQRVLEIGAGTGYNAALMAFLVGPSGRVVTIDIDADIVDAARDHLAAAGVANVLAVLGDGAEGYPDGAPYDRVILTVGADDVAPAWWRQTSADGRLVLPLALGDGQRSVAFVHQGEQLVSISSHGCGFMPLRGALAESSGRVRQMIHSAAGPLLFVGNPMVDVHRLAESLGSAPRVWETDARLASPAEGASLAVWIALHDSRFCRLHADRRQPPPALTASFWPTTEEVASAFGLADRDGAAALVLVADDGAEAAAVSVVAYGAAEELARDLLHLANTWQTRGRPAEGWLRVRAFRQPSSYPPLPYEVVVDRRFCRFVLDWPPEPAAT